MYRTRDWRRAQTKKKIDRRIDIMTNVWQYGFKWYGDEYLEEIRKRPHRFSKFNLNCGCKMCQAMKDRPNENFSLDTELDTWYDEEELNEDMSEFMLRELEFID
jgi:hypothetical protein